MKPETINPMTGVFGVSESSTGNMIANAITITVKDVEIRGSPCGESN